MTAILRATGRKVWGQSITSQMYRQVTIGITEKHVREVFAPFNRYDDHSTTADKMLHLRGRMTTGQRSEPQHLGWTVLIRINFNHHCSEYTSGHLLGGTNSFTKQAKPTSGQQTTN